MWALRVLNGPMAGQTFPLPQGKVKIGRAASCQVQINGPGISKEHVEITIMPDKMLINDLRSSNGTYLNGVRIQGGFLKVGDKILVSQMMFDIVLMQEQAAPRALTSVGAQVPGNYGMQLPVVPGHGQAPGQGYPYNTDAMMASAPSAKPPPSVGGFFAYQSYALNQYMDNVVLPGIYRLPRLFEFRFVLMGFVALFILIVTLLSLVPLNQITKESIAIESERRALTVARALSDINQRVLRSGDFAGFRTDLIMKEEGIEDAYVLSADGKILAPPERTGISPKHAGFVQKIKGSIREVTDHSIGGRVAASVPVVQYDQELMTTVPKAYAVVIYNPGNLTFDDGRAFSLFVQVLTLSLFAGVLLFFVLYKLIQYPYRMLHEQIDANMRDGTDRVQIDFQFPELQNLMTSVNSLLSRVASGGGNDMMTAGKGSRDGEIANLMQLIGYPSILISRDGKIARLSPTFEQLTGISSDRLTGAKISDIPDPAMQQNFNHLMNQAQLNLSQIYTDSLEIGGHNFNLNCQALADVSGDIEYFLITVTPVEGQEGAA